MFNLAQGNSGRLRDRALTFGLLGAAFVLVLGNLEGILELAYAHGLGGDGFWGWLGIKGLAAPYFSHSWFPTDGWWWWKATRVIDTVVNGLSRDYTITEFPFFSFLLGDLHPHVSALPLGLLSLGLSLELLRQPRGLSSAWLADNLGLLAATALAIGALGFANSWDLPTYAALWLVCLAIWAYSATQPWWWLRAAALGGAVLAGAVLLYFPFYRSFSPQASGVWPVLGPTTWPVHYLIVWGAFLLPVAYLVLGQARLLRGAGWGVRGLALGVALAPLVLWTAIALVLAVFGGKPGFGEVAWRWVKLLPLVAGIALALAIAFGSARRDAPDRQRVFALVLVAVGLGVTYVPELFYIRDLFGNRMNTMFKLYYQGWVMISLAAAYGLYCWGWPWGKVLGARSKEIRDEQPACKPERSEESSQGQEAPSLPSVAQGGAGAAPGNKVWPIATAWASALVWGLAMTLLLGALAYPVAAFASRGA
ncbi:MAG: DUF2298 domain-containing protein, partial [Chloroflexota bacterium]